MTTGAKVDLVKKILNSEEIGNWYRNEFNFTADMVDVAAVSSSHSDLCMQILLDARDSGLLTAEQIEEFIG